MSFTLVTEFVTASSVGYFQEKDFKEELLGMEIVLNFL